MNYDLIKIFQALREGDTWVRWAEVSYTEIAVNVLSIFC